MLFYYRALNGILVVFIGSILILGTLGFNSVYGVPIQTYVSPTPLADDRFGAALDIDGNNVIIGTLNDRTGVFDSGRAFLFDTSGNLLQSYTNPSPGVDDHFGNAVAIDGNNVVIAASVDSDDALNAGRVFLYDTSGNLLQTYGTPDPPSAIGDQFGFSVDISGSLIVIGEPFDDITGFDSGIAYLYDTSGNLLQTFNNPTPETQDHFGWDVAISGNIIIIGAPNVGPGVFNVGEAYLFDTSGNLIQTLTPNTSGNFGYNVDIDGNNVLVAAMSELPDGNVYLFDTSGNFILTIPNPAPGPGDTFGLGLAIDGTNIIIGAPFDDTQGSQAGQAYHYDTSGNLIQTFDTPAPKFNGFFGYAVGCSGNFALVGEANRLESFSGNVGMAYLFEKVSTVCTDDSQCNDSNACTTDTCNTATGQCSNPAIVCDDNDACNGLESCNTATGCVAGTPLVCDDGQFCTLDSCNTATGCVLTPNPDPSCQSVGGEFIGVDNSALLVTGFQANALWLLPAIAAIGIGVVVIRRIR